MRVHRHSTEPSFHHSDACDARNSPSVPYLGALAKSVIYPAPFGTNLRSKRAPARLELRDLAQSFAVQHVSQCNMSRSATGLAAELVSRSATYNWEHARCQGHMRSRQPQFIKPRRTNLERLHSAQVPRGSSD